MLILLRNFFHMFLFDESAARRWLYGLGGFAITIATSLMVFGLDTILGWSLKDFLRHVAVAAVGAVMAMLPGPKLNRPAGSPPPLDKGWVRIHLLVPIAVLALAGGGCAWWNAHKRALGQDLKQCAMQLGSSEWNLLRAKAWQIVTSGAEGQDVHELLHDLEAEAVGEAVAVGRDCVSHVLADLLASAPTDPTYGPVVQERCQNWLAAHPVGG